MKAIEEEVNVNPSNYGVSINYEEFQNLLSELLERRKMDEKRRELFRQIELFLTYLDENYSDIAKIRNEFNQWNDKARLRRQNGKLKVEIIDEQAS